MKKAFTLAEILIVLTVIGIISAIIMPIAFNSTPNENVLKFKKANETLFRVINELTNSDTYHQDGDLGIKADGTLLTSTSANYTYFCDAFADIVTYKTKTCSTSSSGTSYVYVGASESTSHTKPSVAKTTFDSQCASNAKTEILTNDGITYYQVRPATTFGMYNTGTTRLFSPPGSAIYKDESGFDAIYKIVCFDVDGINSGEAPFGYGVRGDGKILSGARADEWVQKSIQNK